MSKKGRMKHAQGSSSVHRRNCRFWAVGFVPLPVGIQIILLVASRETAPLEESVVMRAVPVPTGSSVRQKAQIHYAAPNLAKARTGKLPMPLTFTGTAVKLKPAAGS